MKTMVFTGCEHPLQLQEMTTPEPSNEEVRIQINACGVCRTDLHIIQGDLNESKPAIVPGSEIVGTVEKIGMNLTLVIEGNRVGVPWLGKTCGKCEFCISGQESLCDGAQFTGYHLNGGFSEYCVAHELACYLLPENYSDIEIAPLMCAGLIRYRSFQMAGDCHTIVFLFWRSGSYYLPDCKTSGRQSLCIYPTQ